VPTRVRYWTQSESYESSSVPAKCMLSLTSGLFLPSDLFAPCWHAFIIWPCVLYSNSHSAHLTSPWCHSFWNERRERAQEMWPVKWWYEKGRQFSEGTDGSVRYS
jgi:hypothetical protein